jgi:hypothetical protein
MLKHPETASTKRWNLYEQLLVMAAEEESLRTMYVSGPPGIGKTWLAYHMGVSSNQKLCAITLTDETPAAELRGHYLIAEGGHTYFHYGPLSVAMKEGSRLVINEITRGNADCMAILYPFLEDPSTARLTLPNGETLLPTKGFHVIATDNYEPDKLPEALQDRFQVFIELSDPHPAALALLPPEFWLAAVIERHEYEDLSGISARQWNNLCLMDAKFDLKVSCALVWGPKSGRTVYDNLLGMWAKRTGWTATEPHTCRQAAREQAIEQFGIKELAAEVTDAG